MKTNKYFVQNRAITHEEIHEKRCEHDPIYSLLFFPKRGELIKFVDVGIQVICKKYKFVEEHRVFRLVRSINDDTVRIFTVLVLICWETGFRTAIEESYDHQGLFGANDVNHFRSFVGKIDRFVDQTIKFSYDHTNIMEIIENFVAAARAEYMMGPF